MDLETLGAGDLAGHLQEARRRTVSLVEDLDDAQLFGPLLPIVNPLLWEIGHVGWFQERWALRHLRGEPPVRADGDALYDSSAVAHDTRWSLPLPSREGTLAYVREILDRVLDRLDRGGAGALPNRSAYLHLLALFHEDMHAEAFAMTRQTLGYPPPPYAARPEASGDGAIGWAIGAPASERAGDIEIPGGEFLLGSRTGTGFVFDNEKWAHPVRIDPFRMARAATTQGEYLAFVEDGGYARRDLWSPAGWAWREGARAEAPVYWRREGKGAWARRWFDRWLPLEAALPAHHVSWHEAEAFCRWARRRLPTEAEWERAAAWSGSRNGVLEPSSRSHPSSRAPERPNLDGDLGGPCAAFEAPTPAPPRLLHHLVGNVWEWTASDFHPYPGFSEDPYRDYSRPWFGDHKVLRGGAWLTRSRLVRPAFRNFYTPDRRDVWAGFRTCALQEGAGG